MPAPITGCETVRVAAVQPTPVILDAGPLDDTDGIIFADFDLREALRTKRYFDVVGHDARADILAPRPRNLPS